jgi:heterodisulfide reductase subunit B
MGAWSYTLYTGCLIRSRLPHVERSARAALERLGVELFDAKGVSCCPEPVGMRSLSPEVWLTLAARNLSILAESGRPVMTLCNGCYATFREAEHLLSRDNGSRERIGRNLGLIGRECSAPEVEHFARFVYEKVGPDRLKRLTALRLTGLKAAFHPGCHLSRPQGLLDFDDPENPTKIEEILGAVGIEVVDYPRKSLCCGFALAGVDADLSLTMGFEKLKAMKLSGAQAVVVTCPSCLLQFDVNQQQMERKFETKLGLPVFYLTELLALALGESRESLGFGLHRVSASSVLEALLSGEHAVPRKGCGTELGVM